MPSPLHRRHGWRRLAVRPAPSCAAGESATRIAAAIFAISFLASPSQASPGPAAAEPETTFSDGAEGHPLVGVELKGLLRARGQWIGNGSLGNDTSGLPTPASAGAGDVGAGDRLAQADLRLRLQPALQLGSYARIDSQLELAGAMVFGGDPRDGAVLGDAAGFDGQGAVRGGFGVRRLWATFDVFGLASFEVGRTPDHFGLGLHRNDGRDPRADWQSEVDRVRVSTELLGLQLRLSRDTMATLPMVSQGLGALDLRYAVADSTDVIRWLAEVENAVPADAPGLRWAFAIAYQDQAVGLALEHDDVLAGKLDSDCVLVGACANLVTRNATLVTPQAFVAWRRPTALGALTLQAEAVVRVGTLDNADDLASTDTSKIIVGGGGMVRGDLVADRWALRLDLGYASGDEEGGFGVLDRANLTAPGPTGEVHRTWLTGMPWHRGMLVDGLLFREIIGAVANSGFVRPALRRNVLGQPASAGDRTLGVDVELAAVAAMAARVGATPGSARWLGLQPELRVDARLGSFGTAILHGSWLLPGAGFAAGPGGKPADSAFRLALDWVATF